MSLGAFRLNGISAAAAVAASPTITGGDFVTIDGAFTVRRFTSASSSLIVSSASTSVDYLVVAAGGAQNSANPGNGNGGAGAGGLKSGTSMSLAPATYTVTVGQGAVNANGGNSVFNGITSTGGGKSGTSGASGGGASGNIGAGSGIAGQGFAGGGYNGGNGANGGGGGAGAVGNSGSASPASKGGDGLTSTITGKTAHYAGGGGGSPSGAGGLGGGGRGGLTDVRNTGLDNYGGGRGGGSSDGRGGHGIVIVRHPHYGESRTASTWTRTGTPVTSTTTSKFGTASWRTSGGTGNYIRTQFLPLMDIGTGDFTFECWVNLFGTSNNSLFSLAPRDGSNNVEVRIRSSGIMDYRDASGLKLQTTSAVVTAGTWQHVAWVRSSGVTKIYANGVSDGNTYADVIDYTYLQELTLGYYSGANNGIDAGNYTYIDDFRVSKSARYTTTFTPPTAAFTNDANTIILMQFDGADGGTTFTDSTT